jgi:uncharacterized hydrophobic protein (TIGR00271 family)
MKKLLLYLSLRNEIESFDVIHAEIEKGIHFKGTNLRILVLAIFIASIGLNTNSTAVIIGAMLISPLMGPINGMGYSIATYDFTLLKTSLKNYAFAVVASLISSTLYFAITPVSTAQSELLSRINPTIYDVLIALFGGLAGILAISSKLKGNIIPGVAIATALMPPLCTAGYGLATLQFHFFYGAFYLFLINTVFIGVSTIITARLLKFPIRSFIENSERKKLNTYISLVLVITIVPSLILGYNLVQNEKMNNQAIAYCNSITSIEGAYLLKHNIDISTKTIDLVYGGIELTKINKQEILAKANTKELKKFKINIKQGFAFDVTIKNEKNILQNQLGSLSATIKLKEIEIDSLKNIPQKGQEILQEIKTIYPSIYECAYSQSINFGDTLMASLDIINFNYNYRGLTTKDKIAIKNWLKIKLKKENVQSYFHENPKKRK